jgi:hypothetical protein
MDIGEGSGAIISVTRPTAIESGSFIEIFL